ncbi:uncharacterized protein LOC130827887 [Amaranthus tricolor]|uniref:uncharacterized protein LOC130827887 n=1 Tax=Amaranthus tricolor TaxID=29722 RepID=UPI0025899EAD|nr:uncharacterized protein LOC130827887 [Amaranthus tricolor]
MDFFKVRRFRKVRKPDLQEEFEKPIPQPKDPNHENENIDGKSVVMDAPPDADDDDDDFITNEVKRRLKELKRNSFMVLIPEEEGGEEDEEEEGETSSSEGRDIGTQVEHLYCDFESIYIKYCERMLFFDRMSSQQLNVAGNGNNSPSTRSPRGASRKLVSSFRCLSLKKVEEPDSDTEQLQKPDDIPYQDLETAYVAHICLTWEALHSQYTQLSQKISCQPENNPTCYNHCAQQYQQFDVLLQRFIENEPFEQGSRVEKYARSRNSLSKLLQVPKVQGVDQNMVDDDESDYRILAPDLLKLIQTSILTFYTFLKMDKKKAGGIRNLFGSDNQIATSLQHVQQVVEKKRLKLKELCKKKSLKKSWPSSHGEVDILLSLIDAKIVSRVLRMARITKEQLLWCEDKMQKVNLSNGKLHRDPSPVLFPC